MEPINQPVQPIQPAPAMPDNPAPKQVNKQTKPAKNNSFLVTLLSILLLLAVGAAGFFAWQTQNLVKQMQELKIANAQPTVTPSPQPTTNPTIDPTSNWETYKNSSYSFEIKYPSNYKLEEGTYGWPKSIITLHAGGQSYDLIIEVWDTEVEYKEEYNPVMIKNITVFEDNDKFITLNNQNNEPEVSEIISTFKFTNIKEVSPTPAI